MLVMRVMMYSSLCAMPMCGHRFLPERRIRKQGGRPSRESSINWEDDFFTTNKIFILQKSNRPFFKKKVSSRDKEQFFHSYC